MLSTQADRLRQRRRLLERKQIKQFLYKLSTTPVPEKKPSPFTNRERPSYLRYIEYV